MFGAVWNRDYIDSIQIRVKESIWTSKPGADIEDCGIVRNVMRSMLQILGFICMEKPVALDAEDVRNEKVKLLRSIKALTKEDLLLGQYGKSIDGEVDNLIHLSRSILIFSFYSIPATQIKQMRRTGPAPQHTQWQSSL
ncbi:Glucose-6-phosphate 1-dehydrogenase [Irineochytrium annulatum]|nr:Glucose-6-phosphate 1-dehydrogenase [Irineochytrium annulatum]